VVTCDALMQCRVTISTRQACKEHSLEITERAGYSFIAFWHLNQVVIYNRTAGLFPVQANGVQWVNTLDKSVNLLCECRITSEVKFGVTLS